MLFLKERPSYVRSACGTSKPLSTACPETVVLLLSQSVMQHSIRTNPPCASTPFKYALRGRCGNHQEKHSPSWFLKSARRSVFRLSGCAIPTKAEPVIGNSVQISLGRWGNKSLSSISVLDTTSSLPGCIRCYVSLSCVLSEVFHECAPYTSK